MALRREMYDAVDIVLLENLVDRLGVADVRLDKCVVGLVLDVLQVLKVACIGKLVHIYDTDLIAVFFEHVVDVVGADEAGASRNDVSSHVLFSF